LIAARQISSKPVDVFGRHQGEVQGRIVLVSDGVADGRKSVARTLADLKARVVAVDVLADDYTYNNEVWLERLVPPRSEAGRNLRAAMVLPL